jgi:predicted DCC family thiol-disulfide oxidoreductase YuxK
VTPKKGPGLDTIAEAVAVKIEHRHGVAEKGRQAENVSLYFGLGVAALGVLVESAKNLGLVKGAVCAEHWWQMIPWFNLSVLVVCVLPKMVGRATYGKIWENLSSRFGKGNPSNG